MFPNPVRDRLTIQSESAIQYVSVYDINGRMLKSSTLSNPEINYVLNINELSKGIYFIKIQTDSGIQTGKVIKE